MPGQAESPRTGNHPNRDGFTGGPAGGRLSPDDHPRRQTGALGIMWPRSIGGRLGRILVLSLTMMLVLIGIMVSRQIGVYQSAAMTANTVQLALQVQDLVHPLQRERGLTNGLLSGTDRFRPQVNTTRGLTDKSRATLEHTLSTLRDHDANAVRAAMGKLADLATVRDKVDGGVADRTATFKFYTDAIAALNKLDLGLDQAQDPELRHGLQALYALADAKEYTGQERGFLAGVFSTGRFAEGEYLKFATMRGGRSAALAEYNQFASPDQRHQLDLALGSTAAIKAAQAAAIVTTSATSARGPLTARVDPVAWWTQMTTVIDQMRTVQQSVGANVTQRAGDLQRSATRTLVAFLLLAGAEMTAEILLVVAVGRSVSTPLRALSREADDVSTRRLPAAVDALQLLDEEHRPEVTPVTAPAHAGAEVKSVALALDRLQSTALALATDQAMVRRNITESLANLGRRNQNLVRRQLGLISEFERDELDPSALANLFELDHLATRMRRNAESLLVLVGLSSPRPWSEPLPVADVVRAGVSEVEEYRRVMLRRVDEAKIIGSAVTEVAHMLAELIENGLSFSPPDVEVEVYGRLVGSRYLLVIVDQGVGMTSEMMTRANARLRGEENFVLAPTRFLGHYVVGRLAQRLGAEVELAPSPVTGVTARVLLPAELLAEPAGKTAAPAFAPAALPAAMPAGNGVAAVPATTPQPSAPPAVTADTVTGAVPVVESPPGASEPLAARYPEPSMMPAAPPGDPHQPAVPQQPTPSQTVPSYRTAHRPLRASQRQQSALLGREDSGRHPAPAGPPDTTAGTGTGGAAGAPGPLLPPASAAPSELPSHPHAPTPPAAAFQARLPETPSPPPAPPAAAEALTDQVGMPVLPPRTRNGLIKRIPAGGARAGNRMPAAAGQEPAANPVPPARQPAAEPAAESARSPEEIRTMLSAFRSGHQRGTAERPSRPMQAPPYPPENTP